MKRILVTTIALLSSVTCLCAQGGVDFSGCVETTWGIAAPWTEENSAGKFTLGTTSFTGTVDAYYENSSAYAQAALSYDATSNKLDLSLNEVYLDYSSSFWGIRIGRQKASWGKADGIDITNVLCPTNMKSFSSMISDNSQLAIDAIRFSISGNQFTADAYWIPFFTPAALPVDEGNTLRSYLVPETSLPVSLNPFEKPELAIWNGEYALRVSGYFSSFDVSLYGFYGWDDMPLLKYNFQGTYPSYTGIEISGQYKHMGMIGADAAVPIGETVLRLETAFFPQRHFQKSAEQILSGSESSQQNNQLCALAGIDWMPSGWTITAQYYCNAVFGDIDSLEREDAYEHGSTISVSKTFVNETLEVSLAANIGFNAFDCLISPSITYSLSDQISLGASAFLFLPGPEKDGKYGAFKDLSSICINAQFSF